VAAKNPTRTTASPILPRASVTGSATWLSASTVTRAGIRTTAAQPAIASETTPPSGKPMSTFARIVPRSRTDQPSSTPPLEKKNTSYGVIAAPKSATA
jgi:hypothetical protein